MATQCSQVENTRSQTAMSVCTNITFMSESTDTSFEEQSLPVHDGRILAYVKEGNLSSRNIVLQWAR